MREIRFAYLNGLWVSTSRKGKQMKNKNGNAEKTALISSCGASSCVSFGACASSSSCVYAFFRMV
jgi:hypothetical protein